MFRLIWNLTVLTAALFVFSPHHVVFAEDACPDLPICGGESLEYFITDHTTGQPITDGMVVPVNTWLDFNARATAYGECDPFYLD